MVARVEAIASIDLAKTPAMGRLGVVMEAKFSRRSREKSGMYANLGVKAKSPVKSVVFSPFS